MMELNEVNRYTKEHLYDFLEGMGKKDFSDEDHNRLIRISFLLNNLYQEDHKIVFEYENIKANINMGDVRESFLTTDDLIIQLLTLEEYDVAYKQFRTKYDRDKKIKNILNEESQSLR